MQHKNPKNHPDNVEIGDNYDDNNEFPAIGDSNINAYPLPAKRVRQQDPIGPKNGAYRGRIWQKIGRSSGYYLG